MVVDISEFFCVIIAGFSVVVATSVSIETILSSFYMYFFLGNNELSFLSHLDYFISITKVIISYSSLHV